MNADIISRDEKTLGVKKDEIIFILRPSKDGNIFIGRNKKVRSFVSLSYLSLSRYRPSPTSARQKLPENPSDLV